MAINYKTSAIDLNVPAKVLPCNVLTATPLANWEYDDGKGDPWWGGGGNAKAYRWEISMTVTTIQHGSHLTRTARQFNGYDIVVGDFIAGATDGRALQIVSISEKTAFTVKCQVEDRLRYNTFRSASGTGIFNVPGGAVVFQINEEGDPMLDPLPTGIVSSDFYANVNSRFKYLNPQMNYVLEQTANGFEEGDVICMDATTGAFELAAPDNIERLVGTVTHPGPGPNRFLLRPANGVIDFVPGLPGNKGDFVYPAIDGSGDLTLTDTGVAIFLKLVDEVPSTTRGTVINGQATAGDTMNINGEDIVFITSSLGVVSVQNAVTDINAKTADHKVTASASPAPNEITSDIATYGSAYGLIGGFAPFSASINGSVVNFSTTAAGQAAYGMAVAIADDMAADINAAGITDITASVNAGNLVISQAQGSAITIVNTSPDANNNNFAGMNSCASLGLTYAGSSNVFVLQLERTDGGEIILQDAVGSATNDFGILSGHTGSYAVGLNVEQGVRKAGTTVVSNIAARDAIPVKLAGDSVYILDTGQGEWAMHVWDGTQWNIVATQDSASTDANSLSHTYTMPSASFGTTEVVTLGRISDNSRVVSVLVEVVTPLSGYAGGPNNLVPSLEIGTVADPSRFMTEDQNDVEGQGSYTTTPDFHYEGTTELEIKCSLEHLNANAGEVKVTVTYV
tara:strand:- start:199 stop:2244 length:2046 start_codon:yes stop_codon:yes gene_type:complete